MKLHCRIWRWLLASERFSLHGFTCLAGGALLHQLLPSIARIFTCFYPGAAAAIPLGLLMGDDTLLLPLV